MGSKVAKLALLGLVGVGGVVTVLIWPRASSFFTSSPASQTARSGGVEAQRARPTKRELVSRSPSVERGAPPVRPELPSGGIRIPRDDEASMKSMTEKVALTPTQVRRVKPLLTNLLHAQDLVNKYPEPKREEKQALLERQAYTALLTAVGSEQWPLLDQYLASL